MNSRRNIAPVVLLLVGGGIAAATWAAAHDLKARKIARAREVETIRRDAARHVDERRQ
jgi:hypothetical protein